MGAEGLAARGRPSGRTTASAPPSLRAPQLRAAYADADAPSTGASLALWEATTLGVVGDDVGAASGEARRRRPRAADGGGGSGTVDYSTFLERYAASARRRSTRWLRRPTTSRGSTAPTLRSGDADAATFRAACRALHTHVGDAAAPCADADALLGAPGRRAGAERRRVAITRPTRRPPAGAEVARRRSARRRRVYRLDLHDIAAGAGEGGSRGSEMVIAEDDSDERRGRPSGMDVDGERSSSLRESSSSEPLSLGLTRGAPIGVPRVRGSLPIGGSHAIAMSARAATSPGMRD